ncbi:MAG: hypothetical protein V1721_07025 [Pseudomonadota bacterium]
MAEPNVNIKMSEPKDPNDPKESTLLFIEYKSDDGRAFVVSLLTEAQMVRKMFGHICMADPDSRKQGEELVSTALALAHADVGVGVGVGVLVMRTCDGERSDGINGEPSTQLINRGVTLYEERRTKGKLSDGPKGEPAIWLSEDGGAVVHEQHHKNDKIIGISEYKDGQLIKKYSKDEIADMEEKNRKSWQPPVKAAAKAAQKGLGGGPR